MKELVLPHEPSSFSDELEFSFRHNLIRDGAYDSLPKALRAEKHARVGRWAQERAGDRAEEIAELIATHYVEATRYLDELGVAGDDRAAIDSEGYRWACAAGDRTAALWQRAEAVRWYRAALALSEPVGATTPERASLARRLTAVGLATESAGGQRGCRAPRPRPLHVARRRAERRVGAGATLVRALPAGEGRGGAHGGPGRHRAARAARRERGARRRAADALAVPGSARPRRGGGADRQARARDG